MSKDTEFDLSAFLAKNQKNLLVAGASVAVVGLSTWLWLASADRRAIRAEQLYVTAERSFYSNNAQLAEGDLGKVIERYANTPAGVRASILLAKNYYRQSKPADGVNVARAALDRSAAKPFRPALNALVADGFENQNKFDSAATAYAAAAAGSTAQTEREKYQAEQARALASAGKKPDAIKVWQTIASRETSPLVSEAKLRIAELSATPAKGS